MSSIQEQLRTALRRYFNDSDEKALVDLLATHPELVHGVEFLDNLPGKFPDVHRIADVQISSGCFRILRRASEAERLFVVVVNNPDLLSPGVPLSIDGDLLQRWVEDESIYPSKVPTDWTQYFGEPRRDHDQIRDDSEF